MNSVKILVGDCRETLKTLDAGSVRCCVTSPPYWGLRDYGEANQLGLEATPEAYVEAIVGVFREVRRVLADDGTLWLNLGDSYCASPPGKCADPFGTSGLGGDKKGYKENARESCRTRPVRDFNGLKPKDLCGIPWRVAFGLQADGWYLRSEIIWSKPNPMPESVTDRPTKAHEQIFLLTKQPRYYYNAEAIREPFAGNPYKGRDNGANCNGDRKDAGKTIGITTTARNKRSVWTVPTAPYSGAHFATFPPDLIKPCVMAGTEPGDTVLDPFGGSGTTGEVALELGRSAILCELNPEYAGLADRRTNVTPGLGI